MKKKVLVSAVALLTSFLAVGCSNSGASRDAGSSTYKVHKSSKKSNQKSSSQADSSSSSSSSADNDSSATSSSSSDENSSKSSTASNSSSSAKSSNESSAKTNDESSSSSTQASSSSKSSANTQSSSTTQAASSGDISESDFQTVVNDTIKRNKYPAGTTVKDFSVMQSGNQIDVAEKKTGAIIAHYTVKNGHLYYYDVVTDQQEQVK